MKQTALSSQGKMSTCVLLTALFTLPLALGKFLDILLPLLNKTPAYEWLH